MYQAKSGQPEPEVESYPYVLIGCGPAVLSAAAKIRELDPNGEVGGTVNNLEDYSID